MAWYVSYRTGGVHSDASIQEKGGTPSLPHPSSSIAGYRDALEVGADVGKSGRKVARRAETSGGSGINRREQQTPAPARFGGVEHELENLTTGAAGHG